MVESLFFDLKSQSVMPKIAELAVGIPFEAERRENWYFEKEGGLKPKLLQLSQ